VFSILWVILGHTFLTAGLSPFVGKYDRLLWRLFWKNIFVVWTEVLLLCVFWMFLCRK
jgi:hypothetical protein